MYVIVSKVCLPLGMKWDMDSGMQGLLQAENEMMTVEK